MKRQYIFIILIVMVLYMLYLIINSKYKEHKVNTQIELIKTINQDIKQGIKKAESIIEFKSSRAYKNKIIKEQLGMKNIGEKVVYLTPEKKYNKFTKEPSENIEEIKPKTEEESIIETMTNYQKWIYFLFGKDTR